MCFILVCSYQSPLLFSFISCLVFFAWDSWSKRQQNQVHISECSSTFNKHFPEMKGDFGLSRLIIKTEGTRRCPHQDKNNVHIVLRGVAICPLYAKSSSSINNQTDFRYEVKPQ